MTTRRMRRSGMLALTVLAAGATAAAVAAPAQAATAHPALTWVQGYYYGGSPSASGCSQVGGIGYSQGLWIDWNCYEIYSNPSNPSTDEWELVVTD